VRGRRKDRNDGDPDLPRLSHPYKFGPLARAKFLEVLERTGSVTDGCRAVGIHPKTAYEHRKLDDEFAYQWQGALDAIADRLEKRFLEWAHDGWFEDVWFQDQKVGEKRKKSDALILAAIRAWKPDRYAERRELKVDATVRGPMVVPAALPDEE
jgi:hypothetical protein